jgi:hypothetical protein
MWHMLFKAVDTQQGQQDWLISDDFNAGLDLTPRAVRLAVPCRKSAHRF